MKKQKRWKERISCLLVMTLLSALVPLNVAQAAGTEELVLGNPSWVDEDTVCFPDIEVTMEGVHTVMVTVNPASRDQGWVELTGDDYGRIENYGDINPTMKDSYDLVATWIFQDAKSAKDITALLKDIAFKYEKGMTVKVIVDSNEVKGDFYTEGITLTDTYLANYNDHYYMYVPYNVSAGDYAEKASWGSAYNLSKEYIFMGMPGYLATITSTEEAKVLHDIFNKAAWCGGTLLLKNGTEERLNDPDSIQLNDVYIYSGDNSNLIPHRAKVNGTVYQTDVEWNQNLYYWACGPEAGTLIHMTTENLWGENEPDYSENQNNEYVSDATLEAGSQKNETCIIANYENKEGLNDIKEGNYSDPDNQGARAYGYFVEFGGYPGDTSSQNRDIQTLKLERINATGTVTNGSFSGQVAPTPLAQKGVDYTTTITADSNHRLPDSITVTVGGTTLNPNQYTWDQTTGKVLIPGAVVTGDIHIVADCPESYNVSHKVTGGSYTGESTVDPGQKYTSTIKPNDGYELPGAISVTVGGVKLTEGTDYTWNKNSGQVEITGKSVTGDVVITVICTTDDDDDDDDDDSGSNGGSGDSGSDSSTDIYITGVPKTGDAGNMSFYMGVMLLAVGGLGGCVFYSAKRKPNK